MQTVEQLKALTKTKAYRNHSVYAEGDLYYIFDNDCTLTVEGDNIVVESNLENTMHEGCVVFFDDVADAYEFFCSVSIEDEQ